MQRNPLVNNRQTGFVCNTCVFVFPGTCVFVYLHFLHFYCPQSFSGGGLYLKGSWLLWSVYDGLLWSVCDGLLWSVKNGLLWYMGHTSMCQFHTQW